MPVARLPSSYMPFAYRYPTSQLQYPRQGSMSAAQGWACIIVDVWDTCMWECGKELWFVVVAVSLCTHMSMWSGAQFHVCNTETFLL